MKIAYWFTKLNAATCHDEVRKQVLFCGPSNSSVDVVSGILNSSFACYRTFCHCMLTMITTFVFSAFVHLGSVKLMQTDTQASFKIF